MHLIVASSAFDVSFRQLARFAPGRVAALFQGWTMVPSAIVRILGLAAQGLMFAVAMWLLLAAPGFLSQQESPIRLESARQASR